MFAKKGGRQCVAEALWVVIVLGLRDAANHHDCLAQGQL